MSNFGVSRIIPISGQEFAVLKGFKLSKIEDADFVAKPPKPSSNSDILGITAYVNKHHHFTFAKISPPLYGDDKSVARHTGIIANEPDYVADFHFIGLMRAIDDMLLPKYSGYIEGKWDSIGVKQK